MASGGKGLFKRLKDARVLERWRTAAHDAHGAELSILKRQRNTARDLRDSLNELIHVADGRLALPRLGSSAFPRPSGTLWAWRPQVWRGPLSRKGIVAVENKTRLGDEVALFHDCKNSELTLRQIRNTKEEDLAPFGLRLDVFNFDGSFLSLVLNLPDDAVDGLRKKHIIRMSSIVETEQPIEIFVRLNIKNGPNTEQLVQELPMNGHESAVDFDLAYTDLNEKRLEKVWLDLIFENPGMNQVVVRDITLCRYPRAEL